MSKEGADGDTVLLLVSLGVWGREGGFWRRRVGCARCLGRQGVGISCCYG